MAHRRAGAPAKVPTMPHHIPRAPEPNLSVAATFAAAVKPWRSGYTTGFPSCRKNKKASSVTEV